MYNPFQDGGSIGLNIRIANGGFHRERSITQHIRLWGMILRRDGATFGVYSPFGSQVCGRQWIIMLHEGEHYQHMYIPTLIWIGDGGFSDEV